MAMPEEPLPSRRRKEVMRNDRNDSASRHRRRRGLCLLPVHGHALLAHACVPAAGLLARGHVRCAADPNVAKRAHPRWAQVNAPESINLFAVYARNDNARRVVAGLSAATPALADIWQQLDRALDDIPALGAIVAQLTADLVGTRMDRANLLAAMRATLGAHADGDDDPLSYLRDELAEFTGRG